MNTRRNLLLLCTGAAALAQSDTPIQDPPQVLYDTAVKEEAAGRPERAKLLLLTLVATYPGAAAAAKAKTELGAVYLFLEAQDHARAGKSRAAYTSFRTVATAYPESRLARAAERSAGEIGPPARK